MNKKGSQETSSSLIGTVVGIILLLGLIVVLYLVLKPSGQNEDVTTFSYDKIIEDLNKMVNNEIKIVTFDTNSNYALVGFSQSVKELAESDLKDECGKTDIEGKITKPESCQGNACLCLCETDTQLGSFGGGLFILCNQGKTKCTQFKENIIGDLSCSYLLHYNYTKEAKDFEVTKTQDNIIFKSK